MKKKHSQDVHGSPPVGPCSNGSKCRHADDAGHGQPTAPRGSWATSVNLFGVGEDLRQKRKERRRVCEKKWLKKACLGSGFTDFCWMWLSWKLERWSNFTSILFEKMVVDSRVSLQTLVCSHALQCTWQGKCQIFNRCSRWCRDLRPPWTENLNGLFIWRWKETKRGRLEPRWNYDMNLRYPPCQFGHV